MFSSRIAKPLTFLSLRKTLYDARYALQTTITACKLHAAYLGPNTLSILIILISIRVTSQRSPTCVNRKEFTEIDFEHFSVQLKLYISLYSNAYLPNRLIALGNFYYLDL